MSKSYIPSFLKDQSNTNTRVWSGQNNTNKFEALSDNFSITKDKPIINTSIPAIIKFVPATLASITSNTGDFTTVLGSGPKKSFASKFAEQAKNAANPHYVAPPKPINVSSENEFPSLGGLKNAILQPKTDSKPVTLSFAEKAKEWAKQKEDEAAETNRKNLEEEKRHRDVLLHTKMTIVGINRYKNKYSENNDEDEYNYDESSLGDDDSYEVPDDEAIPSEDEEDEDEFNQNIGWDGRRKDDLY